MKVEITEYEKITDFELKPITQICGQNIQKKNYIFESLRRYFSTFKYSEMKNKWRDNVSIDNESVGRKYFNVISIKEISDIIQLIKWSKQSLMMEYVKNLMQNFDWQLHLRNISEEVEAMFQQINGDISKLGKIELTYNTSDVWDMVQKSDIEGVDETELSDMENYELVNIFLNLLDSVIKCSPKKTMVIFENIDHMVNRNEYLNVLNKANMLARKYDIYFLFSSSLDGFVLCNEELCSGISIFGMVDFQMPEFENICYYLREHYPYQKEISDEEIQKVMVRIIQRIGMENYLCSVEENVICKLINESLLLYDKLTDEKLPEMAFLKA